MKKAISLFLSLLLLVFTCGAAFAVADEPAFSTYDEMVEYVRAALIAREENIRFRYTGDDYRAPEPDDLFAYSADGAAGDYLRLSFNGSFPTVSQGADGVYSMTPSYYTNASQEAQVEAFVASVAAACEGETAEEKARYLYDYLCENVQFDLENLYDDSVLLKYTAYGAAIGGKAVCQGFSQLYYRLARAVGLDCRIVTGTRAGEPHAWNIIKLDNYWYHVDSSCGAQLLDPSGYFAQPSFGGYTIVYGLSTASEIRRYPFQNTASSAPYSGSLNATVSYTLDPETYELTIFGSGEVPNSRLFASNYMYGHDYYQACSRSFYIRTIRIMEGITGIASYAFGGCMHTEQIILPDSLTSIGYYAFACPNVRSLAIPTGLSDCKPTSFHYRAACESITVAPGNEIFHAEGDCLIETATKTLVIGCPASVIPTDGSVIRIGNGAFRDHSAPPAITIPGEILAIGDDAFNNSALNEVTFEEGLLQTGIYSFKNTALTSVVLPDSLVQFGGYDFSDCKNLTSVSLPGTLAELRAGLFSGCEALSQVTIPNSVWRIQMSAFANCPNLKHVDLNMVSVIQPHAFDNGVETFSISPENTILTADENGVVFNKDKTELVLYPCGKQDESFVVPETVTSIASHAFYFSKNLKAISVPDSVTNLGVGAFSFCRNLVAVRIPDGVTEIPDGLFLSSAIQSVVIPDGVTKIGASAFASCKDLISIKVPRSVTSVDEGLNSVSLPFGSCPSLTLYGYAGTFIEEYAARKNIPFVTLCPSTDEPHATIAYEAAEATCTEPAYSAGEYCPDCETWITPRAQTAEPLGHSPAEPVRENVTEPTCTAEGSYDSVIRCTRCNEILSSIPEKLAKLAHKDDVRDGYCDECGAYICTHEETALQNEKAASCTENGYSGDTVCMICGATLTYGETVYAPGHTPAISKAAVPATCLAAGRTAEYACTVCGAVTTAAADTPIAGHTDENGDGFCEICRAPLSATVYGAVGNDVFWYLKNETLVITGEGAADVANEAPWQTCSDAFDSVYIKEGVTALSGVPFSADYLVFAPADCESGIPNAISYTRSGAEATLFANEAPALDIYDLLNAAYVFAADRTLSSLNFTALRLLGADGSDQTEYDILKNGKLIDENHFRLQSGALLREFRVSPLGYPSFNAVYAALGKHPDRNLILRINCDDLLPQALRQNAADYTEQIAIRFVDEPAPDQNQQTDGDKNFMDRIIERFHATLAAMLALFKKIVKLFKNLLK